MANVRVKYRCDECGEVHEDEEDALACCRPSITELFQCSVCHAKFEDEDAADEHCAEHGAETPDVPTHAELEAHGQQRLPI